MPFAVDMPPQLPADPPAHVIHVDNAARPYDALAESPLAASSDRASNTVRVSDDFMGPPAPKDLEETVGISPDKLMRPDVLPRLIQDSLAGRVKINVIDGTVTRPRGAAAYLDSEPTAKPKADAHELLERLGVVSGRPAFTVAASDLVPYHGGKGLMLGTAIGSKNGFDYRALGGVAATKDTELNKRFMMFDGRVSTTIDAVPGALGVELTRMQGFALGKMPGEKVLDQGGTWSSPSLVDVPQPLRELKITKGGVFWTAPQLAEGWIHEIHLDKVSYSIGDATSKSYSAVSATAERSLDNLNLKARVEHGAGDNTFNAASVDVKYNIQLPRGYDLALAGGGQVGSNATPAPAMLGNGGPNRGSASPLGAIVAPSGAYGGVEVIAPAVDVLKGARPYVGVNGSVGKMSERSDVRASAVEVGVRGKLDKVSWSIGFAKALESNATDKTRTMAGFSVPF